MQPDGPAGYPQDWLAEPGEPASDVELALLLVNSHVGVCGSDPCRCVFVDRTRGGTRKYCCTYCNDRFAARAYRRRKKG